MTPRGYVPKAPRKPLTTWEAGQELARLADEMSGREYELRPDYPAMADEIKRMRLRVGTLFNALGSHGFMLPSEADAPAPGDGGDEEADELRAHLSRNGD